MWKFLMIALWKTEDLTPALGLYVRDEEGIPHILAAKDRTGWYCMTCPIGGKTEDEIKDHIEEHLRIHQI